MKVRHAVHQDIPKIAEIHVKSWQTTYQGIISQEYLDGLNIAEKEESWRKRSLEGTFVAEDADGVFGFASFGKQRDERYSTYDGELYAIYLLQQKQKSGAGIALIAKGVDYLIEKGYQKLIYGCLNKIRQNNFIKSFNLILSLPASSSWLARTIMK